MPLRLVFVNFGAYKCEVLYGNPDAHITMVSCQKGPTRHAYAWQDSLDSK